MVSQTHLSADRAVDHSEECSRDLAELDSAHECSGDEAGQISYYASAECEDDCIAGTSLAEEPVLDLLLCLAALAALSRADLVADEPRGARSTRLLELGGKLVRERLEVQICQGKVCYKDVCGRRELGEQGSHDVGHEVESEMDRLASEDGDFGYLNVGFVMLAAVAVPIDVRHCCFCRAGRRR